MRIHVGTENPLKSDAVAAAFRAAFPDSRIEVSSIRVHSGVPLQPFGEEVTDGAIARAKGARGDADFGVGIEAGLVRLPRLDDYLNLQVCAIIDRDGRMTVGTGPGFVLPPSLISALQAGSTLNREMSRISGIPEIKAKSGAVGYLSAGVIDRFETTYTAVLMALIPRIRPELYR